MMKTMMVRYQYTKAIYKLKSQNIAPLCILLITVLSGSVMADSMSIHSDLMHNTQTYCHKDAFNNDLIQCRPEEERIQELYAAAKVLESESQLGDLPNHLSILTTREFYTEPRPLTCDNCNRMEFKSLIAPKDPCSGYSPIDLLVQITTIPKEIEGRMAVRLTWGRLTRGNTASVRHMFLFGTGYTKEDQDVVNKEHKLYNDVLQHDYKDAYYNLTYKVVTGFTWATKHCPKAQFILRTATDNLINLPALTKYLIKNYNEIQRIQLGKVHSFMPRFKHRNSKFYVPDIEYPFDTYPRFAIGSAFVYSMKAVEDILKSASNIPFFALEDCWFGMLMQHINMDAVNNDNFDVVLSMGELEAIPDGECPRNGSFFAVHFPFPYTIKNQPTEPYQLLYRLWASCQEHYMPKGID